MLLQHLNDFRPISLVHSFAKPVTKVMANRLAPLLPKLVSANQSAFVKKRKTYKTTLCLCNKWLKS